ncbi:MAG TPA: hypothetical protein VJS91_08290, partial [Nitrososphaeraceae archaeon]|nr:hypothetical protein [Nitrososphaeraceae archaeon]
MIEVHLSIVLSVAVLSMVIGTVILYTTFASSIEDAVQSNKVANQENKLNQIIDQYLAEQNSKFNLDENISNANVHSSPNFMLFDNESGLVRLGLSSFWHDKYRSCSTNFVCTDNFAAARNNGTILQLSTNNSTNQTWSHLYGQEIEVKPKQQYQLLTHMKLNRWASQSHFSLEGYNETSARWYQIKQCPAGTNGPLEWQEFNCVIVIPQNTTKIRPVLNAGWSSQLGKEATTWFDSIYLIK